MTWRAILAASINASQSSRTIWKLRVRATASTPARLERGNRLETTAWRCLAAAACMRGGVAPGAKKLEYAPWSVAVGGATMQKKISERSLLIRSRLRAGYHLSEFGMKNLQHVLTDWFPRAVYADLSDDVVHVDIEIRRDDITGRAIFNVAFCRADGSVSKRTDYPDDKLIGQTCPYYDPKKAAYQGKQDGYDCRLVHYTSDTTAR